MALTNSDTYQHREINIEFTGYSDSSVNPALNEIEAVLAKYGIAYLIKDHTERGSTGRIQ